MPGMAAATVRRAQRIAPRGEVDDAARLIGYVNVQYKELGREPTDKWGYEKLLAALHEQLSDAQVEKFAAQGAGGRKIKRLRKS